MAPEVSPDAQAGHRRRASPPAAEVGRAPSSPGSLVVPPDRPGARPAEVHGGAVGPLGRGGAGADGPEEGQEAGHAAGHREGGRRPRGRGHAELLEVGPAQGREGAAAGRHPPRRGQRLRDHEAGGPERAPPPAEEEARLHPVRAGAFQLDVADGLETARRGPLAHRVPGRPLPVRPRGRDHGGADDRGVDRPPGGLRDGVGDAAGDPHGPRRAVPRDARRDERLRRPPRGARDHAHPGGGQEATTTGKIERWWGTYDVEGDLFETLDDFLFYYNQVRPHQSLDYEKPLEVFLADLPA